MAFVREARDRGRKGGAPNGTTPPATPWPEPIPLDLAVAVPPFPSKVFPALLEDFAAEAAESIACPVDYVAVPLLGIAAGSLGASVALEVKEGYVEPTNLYLATVGAPGSGKTPGVRAAAAPAYAEQGRRYKCGGDQLLVGDTTTEKLAGILNLNRRGVLMIRDELSGWVAGMDQYKTHGRGSDRQFYLSCWAGEPVSIHRKNQEDGPVWVRHPSVTVVGGIQPDLLPRLRTADDGFSDRLLFSFPVSPPARGEDWRTASRRRAGDWEATLASLWMLDLHYPPECDPHPQFLTLAPCGREFWAEFTQGLADRLNAADFPGHMRGVWVKLRAYGARLALVVQMLRAACGETGGTLEVDGESIIRAGKLIDYFGEHARRVYAHAGHDPRITGACAIRSWLVAARQTTFQRSDAWRSLRRNSLFHRPEDLDAPLSLLVETCHLRGGETPYAGRGRRPTDTFEVSPLIYPGTTYT